MTRSSQAHSRHRTYGIEWFAQLSYATKQMHIFLDCLYIPAITMAPRFCSIYLAGMHLSQFRPYSLLLLFYPIICCLSLAFCCLFIAQCTNQTQIRVQKKINMFSHFICSPANQNIIFNLPNVNGGEWQPLVLLGQRKRECVPVSMKMNFNTARENALIAKESRQMGDDDNNKIEEQ